VSVLKNIVEAGLSAVTSVEAGRVELPSEIKPWKTSTCLVFRLFVVPSASGDPNRTEPARCVLIPKTRASFGTSLWWWRPWVQPQTNHTQDGLRYIKQQPYSRNRHLLCFQVIYEVPGPRHAV